MIKNVFIDFDNTLMDFDKAVWEILTRIFLEMGYEFDKEKHQKFLEVNNTFWKAHERGEITVEDIKQNRFKKYFQELKIDIDKSNKIELKFRQGIKNSCIKINGADEILEYLSQKYNVYITSNGVASTQYERIKKAGWEKYFSGIFLSEEIGYQKPKLEFFTSCMKKIGSFKKDEYIIIGDSINSDIKGGKNIGIATCYFNKNSKPLKDITIKPDYVINNLIDIKNIL